MLVAVVEEVQEALALHQRERIELGVSGSFFTPIRTTVIAKLAIPAVAVQEEGMQMVVIQRERLLNRRV